MNNTLVTVVLCFGVIFPTKPPGLELTTLKISMPTDRQMNILKGQKPVEVLIKTKNYLFIVKYFNLAHGLISFTHGK